MTGNNSDLIVKPLWCVHIGRSPMKIYQSGRIFFTVKLCNKRNWSKGIGYNNTYFF